MPQRIYRFKYGIYGETRQILVYTRGDEVYASNYTNKGTAFTEAERQQLGISGSLPPAVSNLEQQVQNSLARLAGKYSDLERFLYLRGLFDRNVVLAHAVIASDIRRFMHVIYTPTVGLACQQYSSMFREANGLHFYPGNIDQAEEILRRYAHRDIRVAVVTDNQGILGIGDQGAGGIAICLGKLMLYTQGAGIAPWHCLPISLDVGTNNEALLNDAFYLGWRHHRLIGSDYLRFMQRFARAFRTVFPDAICQWEDFSKQNAFAIRDANLHNMISFNDDIQGTGAVVLAAILTAMRVQHEKLIDQVFLVHGAGAGGVGIAEQLDLALVAAGLSETEARARIFTMDSHGLVTSSRPLEPYKEKFAKDAASLPWYKDPHKDGTLPTVVKNAGITVLIGTSSQAGSFTPEVVRAMAVNTERPVILPLSNPTDKCEATPADLYAWTAGQALVATGSPFAPVILAGREQRVGQCNNVFVFPGVGLGILGSGASEVLPAFFTAAAHAVSAAVSQADIRSDILMPPVEELREISTQVAMAVGTAAFAAGVSRPCPFSQFQPNDEPAGLKKLVEGMRWQPAYLPLVPM